MKSPVFWIVALALSLCPAVLTAGERSDLPSRILVTSVTYDDGAGNNLQGPSGICFDRHANEVVVAATGNSRISVYDQDLIPRFSCIHFVSDTASGKSIAGAPRSVAVLSSGDILVVDNLAKYVDVLDYRGSPVTQLYPADLAGDKKLQLRATAVCVDDSDNVYLAVTGDLETVLMLNSNFELKRKIGQKGTDTENFSTVLAVATSEGRLYVTDLYGFPAVKVFDTSGQFILGFAGHAQENPDLSMPEGIGLVHDSLGESMILVPDALRHALKVYSASGEFVSIIGGYGVRIGEWQYPSGVAIGTNNVFFVVEKGNGRVQRVEIRPPL